MKLVTLRFWVPETTELVGLDARNRPTLETLTALSLHTDSAEIMTDEQIVQAADGIKQRQYHATVTGICEELKSEIRAGDIADYDSAIEWLEQTIDGHHDVIYTSCAQDICSVSHNADAYYEELGTSDGMIEDGDIQWSKLAYFALLADCREELENLDDWFKCRECNCDLSAEELKSHTETEYGICTDCAESEGLADTDA